MADFKHSDIGSIRCPLHNQREVFKAGTIIQPLDSALVRYPCGYLDGPASASPSTESASPEPNRDELMNELTTRIKRLEERGTPRRTPTMPTPQTPAKKGGVAL